MKITVLDKNSMGEDTPFNILYSLGEVVLYPQTSQSELVQHIDDSDVIILNKVKITESVFIECPKLKLVCVFATGYDNVDITSARKHGVAVCNVPGYSSDSVTLFTVSTVLSLVTHLKEYSDYVKSGEYTASMTANRIVPVFHEIRGKTWGIIGCGNIGRGVLKVAEAFGANVMVYKRKKENSLNCVDIDTLCRESDIITIHCPLNDSTRGLINKERLALMKKSVILVNEARGAVLDEEAVTLAVHSKSICGFGCDVYSDEPFSENHPYNKIKKFDNVILTPHAAWAAYEARERCIGIIAENIKSFLKKEWLNRVDL